MDSRLNCSTASAIGFAVDALVLVATDAKACAALPEPLAALAADAARGGDFEWKAGRTLYLHRPGGVKAPRVVLAAAADATAAGLRKALQGALAVLDKLGATHVGVVHAGFEAAADAYAEVLAAAFGEATYRYRATKPTAAPAPRLTRATLFVDKARVRAAAASLARGAAIAQGVALARDLANRPGNHCTPSVLADEAKALARTYGFKVTILDRKDAHKLGMGAFLAVAQGSEEPPRFIVVEYRGAAKSQAPLVLVGKGITFDSGGISLKPGAEMDEMKFDMGGAASVLGTLRAVGELAPRVNLVALIPACENLPSGRAVKPGDVVHSMAGTTIEILNTDAEGRLILCDALAYAARFAPAAVVDVATLTGACVIALGHHRSGLYSPDDTLAGELVAAADAALDPCWRMPLDADYDEALESNFADVANVGGRAGGSITAAKFLQRFAKGYAWAHLDIAGTAWRSGKAKGATGRPVGLLAHWVLGRAKPAR